MFGWGANQVQKLPALQVLRALAALGVAAAHVWGAPLYHLTAGIDLFFVISGFVMVYASYPLFGKRSSATFAWRRIIRIVPLYWAFVAIILYLGFPATTEEILNTLFFIPYQDAWGNWQPIGFVGWTLNYEMFFYAIFTAAIALPRRIAVAAVVATIVLLALAGTIFQPNGVPGFFTNPIMLEFAFGCALGLAYVEGLRLPRIVAIALFVVAIAVLSCVGAPLTNSRPFVWGLPAAAVVAAACLVKQPWTVGDVGSPLHLLGDASYALYLINLQLSFVMMNAWGYSPTITFWVVILFALAVHFAFERPVLQLARQAKMLRFSGSFVNLPSKP